MAVRVEGCYTRTWRSDIRGYRILVVLVHIAEVEGDHILVPEEVVLRSLAAVHHSLGAGKVEVSMTEVVVGRIPGVVVHRTHLDRERRTS